YRAEAVRGIARLDVAGRHPAKQISPIGADLVALRIRSRLEPTLDRAVLVTRARRRGQSTDELGCPRLRLLGLGVEESRLRGGLFPQHVLVHDHAEASAPKERADDAEQDRNARPFQFLGLLHVPPSCMSGDA